MTTDGRCPAHKRAWVKSNPIKRVTGRKLQRMRERLFAEHPLCAECERQGRVSVAVIRDHVRPLAEGGTDEDDNIQGLCIKCNDIKTKEEAKRGLAR